MERRRVQRIKRRLPCEFVYAGNRHRGIVVDLSVGGLFMQTDTALDPGSEILIDLAGSRFPEVSIRAVVARRRFTPVVLSSMIRRGVGLRIVEAPGEYYEALEAAMAGRAEAVPTPEPADADPVAERDRSPTRDEQPSGTPLFRLRAEPARPEPPAEDPPQTAPPEEPQPEGWLFDPEDGSRALLIGEGELDDVHVLLQDLGARPTRRPGSEAAGFRGWEQPPRLLIASARHVARIRVPASASQDGVATIAVVEADSLTLRSLLRRQGFRYVVRRPVHPEAMRLLLLGALYRGSERRAASRLPLGYELTWRRGWGRRRGVIVELSPDGCRIHAHEAPEPGARVRVRIPRELAAGRALVLAGRVQRCEQRAGEPPQTRHVFVLRFEDLSARSRIRLDDVLRGLATGPATLPGGVRPRRADPARRTTKGSSTEEPAEATAPATPRPERRASARGRLDREVVALDPIEERARHVLFGRDLSLGGMRVEPHPELELGERVRLALYEPSRHEPLLLEAEVERDDGELGLALRFEGSSSETLDRLAEIVAELAPIHPADSEPGGAKLLVVSEIVDG